MVLLPYRLAADGCYRPSYPRHRYIVFIEPRSFGETSRSSV